MFSFFSLTFSAIVIDRSLFLMINIPIIFFYFFSRNMFLNVLCDQSCVVLQISIVLCNSAFDGYFLTQHLKNVKNSHLVSKVINPLPIPN